MDCWTELGKRGAKSMNAERGSPTNDTPRGECGLLGDTEAHHLPRPLNNNTKPKGRTGGTYTAKDEPRRLVFRKNSYVPTRRAYPSVAMCVSVCLRLCVGLTGGRAGAGRSSGGGSSSSLRSAGASASLSEVTVGRLRVAGPPQNSPTGHSWTVKNRVDCEVSR
ncbi:hypothetical protein AOLI_G00030550 [Acnodon oligacanthus]